MKKSLTEMKIEVTYRCNLKCIHCSSNASMAGQDDISEEDCIKIIDSAGKMGVEKIAFSGGEPLAWRPLDRVISRAVDHGIKVVIYTNGNSENIIERLQNFKNLGVEKCVFSLFGSTAEVHEGVTLTKGSFDNTLHAMRESISIGLPTEVHFVPLADNYKDIEPLAAMVAKLGVKRLSILRLVPQGRGATIKPQALNKGQNLELRKSVTNLRKHGYNIRTGSPYNFLLLNDQPKCTAAIDKLTIGPDLEIYPCDAFKQIKSVDVVGSSSFSTLKQNSLEECWQKSEYLNTVRKFQDQATSTRCNNCDTFDKCLSGCLAQKVLAYGELSTEIDPSCLKE